MGKRTHGWLLHSFIQRNVLRSLLGFRQGPSRYRECVTQASPRQTVHRRDDSGSRRARPEPEFHAGTAAAECHHKFTTPNLKRALPTARKPASLVSSLSHSTVEMAITLPLASKLLFLLRFLTPGVMIMTRASQRGQRPSHYTHRCAHARPVLSSTLSSQGRTHVPSSLQTSCSRPSAGHLLPQ